RRGERVLFLSSRVVSPPGQRAAGSSAARCSSVRRVTTKRNLLPRRLAIPSIVLAATGALLGSSALPGREQAPRAMNVLLMGTDERDTISVGEKHAFHAGCQACGC